MSPSEIASASPSSPKKKSGCGVIAIVVGLVLIVASVLVLPCVIELPVMLVLSFGLGWIRFLVEGRLQSIGLNETAWQSLTAAAFFAGALYLAGTQFAQGRPRVLWWMARTSGLMMMGGALCAAGFGTASFLTAFGSLGDLPFGVVRDKTHDRLHRPMTQNHILHLSLKARNRAEQQMTFPAGGTFDDSGRPMHGWITALLAVRDDEIHKRIRLDLPWDAAENREVFRISLHDLLRSGHYDDLHTPNGYAVTDFAANGHVMGGGPPLAPSDVTDGQSTTLLMGESFGHPRPWGSPFNRRDPGRGINATPEGFGGPWMKNGCNFGMVDGSARFISAKIDPAILRKLATPRGGETLSEDEFTRHYDPMAD